MPPEYIILFLRLNMGIQEIQNGIVGAVQAKLLIKNIAAISVPIGTSDAFMDLYSFAKRIFNIISNNQLILSNLHKMKDILLPKLMLKNSDSSSDKLKFVVTLNLFQGLTSLKLAFLIGKIPKRVRDDMKNLTCHAELVSASCQLEVFRSGFNPTMIIKS